MCRCKPGRERPEWLVADDCGKPTWALSFDGTSFDGASFEDSSHVGLVTTGGCATAESGNEGALGIAGASVVAGTSGIAGTSGVAGTGGIAGSSGSSAAALAGARAGGAALIGSLAGLRRSGNLRMLDGTSGLGKRAVRISRARCVDAPRTAAISAS